MTNPLTILILAAPQPGDYDPSTGKGPEWGKAAPIGLLVILLMGVAVALLLRSFTRQLKKVPKEFKDPEAREPQAAGPSEPDARVVAGAADPTPPGRPETPRERGPTSGEERAGPT